VGP
jgi:integrase